MTFQTAVVAGLVMMVFGLLIGLVFSGMRGGSAVGFLVAALFAFIGFGILAIAAIAYALGAFTGSS